MADPFSDEPVRNYLYVFKTYAGKKCQMYGDIIEPCFNFGDLRCILCRQVFLGTTTSFLLDPLKRIYVNEAKARSMFPNDHAIQAWFNGALADFQTDYQNAYP